jgi:enoyl-CoA hydratase
MSFIQILRPRANTTVIRMNRPERMNSMAFELACPLHEAIDEVGQDNDTRTAPKLDRRRSHAALR